MWFAGAFRLPPFLQQARRVAASANLHFMGASVLSSRRTIRVSAGFECPLNGKLSLAQRFAKVLHQMTPALNAYSGLACLLCIHDDTPPRSCWLKHQFCRGPAGRILWRLVPTRRLARRSCNHARPERRQSLHGESGSGGASQWFAHWWGHYRCKCLGMAASRCVACHCHESRL
jgi:hypothetical protein